MIANRGKEVSCKTVQQCLAYMEKQRVPLAPLLACYPHPKEYLMNPSNRVGWESFVAMLKMMGPLLGGPQGFEALGDSSPDANQHHRVRQMMQYFASPKNLFWTLLTFLAPQLFRNVTFVYKELNPTTLLVTVEIHPGYEPIEAFFRVWLAAFRSTPGVLGMPNASVSMELNGPRADYTIRLPASMTLWARLKRAGRVLFAARVALEEMSKQEEVIRSREEELFASEMRLKLASQMASISRMSALGEMAGGVAHEINNPLAIIRMRLELMSSSLRSGPVEPQQLEEQVTRSLQAVSRVAHVVNSLMFFARETGGAPFERTKVREIVANTVQFCEEKLRAARVELHVDSIDENEVIECRPAQISQVLLSLLNNSFDAVFDLPERWIRVSARREGAEIVLAVADSGAGIPSEIHDKIFLPFFTTKELGKGAGLGLSVSRGIIESHHGRLELDSRQTNTTFQLRLPGAQI